MAQGYHQILGVKDKCNVLSLQFSTKWCSTRGLYIEPQMYNVQKCMEIQCVLVCCQTSLKGYPGSIFITWVVLLPAGTGYPFTALVHLSHDF